MTNPSRNTSLLSKPFEAASSTKILCNGLKRTSTLAAACALTGADPQQISDQVDDISINVIKKLGLSSNDQTSMNVLMAIISEPVSSSLTAAALIGASKEEIKEMSDSLIETITTLARSKAVSTQLNARYASEIDATIALRMTSSASLIPVATEIAYFNFYKEESACMKEATKHILSSAFEAADFLSSEHMSVASKVMLTQSLLNSSGKLYAACYRSVAENFEKELNRLDKESSMLRIEETKAQKPVDIMNAITQKFNALFELCINNEFSIPSYLANKVPTKVKVRP